MTFARLLGILPDSEEITGIAPLAAVHPGQWPTLSKALPANGTRAWLGLSEKAEPLLTYQAPSQGVMAWRLSHGKGSIFSYFAPLEWEANGENWMNVFRLPLLFLKDVWTRLVAEKRLARLPASLNLDYPDLYIGAMEEASLLYNAGQAPIHWPGAAGDVILQPCSITRLAAPSSGTPLCRNVSSRRE